MNVVALCAGYDGIGLGLGHPPYAYSEIDGDALTVLRTRFPDSLDLGDLRDITPPDCDLLTAGFPCQPVSHAGRRLGVDDERWLFDDIAEAVGRMGTRPVLLLENVSGLLSANGGAAMACVVHRLADLGYVGRWRVVRASDVGAPHRRARWFCVAHPRSEGWRSPGCDECGARGAAGGEPGPVRGSGRSDRTPAHPGSVGRGPGTGLREGEPGRVGWERSGDHDHPAADADGGRAGGDVGGVRATTAGSRRSGTVDDGEPGVDRQSAPDALGGRRDGRSSEPERGPFGRTAPAGDREAAWGRYWPAIARWEHVIGRPAPPPTDPRGRLNPLLSEWMMGLPQGWVTDLLGRTAALRVIGNGVVPQQAAYAWRLLTGEGCR